VTEVHGRVAGGFEAVAEEFARTLGPDSGAAFAAVVDGEPVVDVWGGAGWREDTIAPVFSGGKGVVAVCLLRLIERGALELAAPVAEYWPGFAAQDVLVRHVVSHTSGLPGLRRGFAAEELLDGRKLAAEIAVEEPFWPPGTRLAYHALSFGWLCDELIRRVDGRSVSRFVAEELAGPLGLELWIGLPATEEPRVVRLARSDGYGITFVGDEPDPLLRALYGGLLDAPFRWNEPAFHQAEIPAANAIASARSLARLYGALPELLAREVLELGRTELSRDRCAVTGRPYAFGVGFELQTELASFGPPADAYGHTGSGGSVHGAWPDERVGFSYATGELRNESDDGRAQRVLAALYDAVT
jgi:CubicO group peptidase (beta-lactamase class C family)